MIEEFGFENLEPLKQKGVYPYEYMDSPKKFSEEKLPDWKCFYSSVKDKATGDNAEKLDNHISNEEYLACEKMWDVFGMKNMGDYHDHYLKKDVLLPADVSEKFINTSLKVCEFDPSHYFSSPGLSWDAMLKMTGVKIETISGIKMYLFIEKRLKRGVSYITKRYTKANNKYMKDYDH